MLQASFVMKLLKKLQRTLAQHLIRQMLGRRQVYWVNTIGMRPPRLLGADAAVPITQKRDLVAIQINAACPVIKQDKIVSGAIQDHDRGLIVGR